MIAKISLKPLQRAINWKEFIKSCAFMWPSTYEASTPSGFTMQIPIGDKKNEDDVTDSIIEACKSLNINWRRFKDVSWNFNYKLAWESRHVSKQNIVSALDV